MRVKVQPVPFDPLAVDSPLLPVSSHLAAPIPSSHDGQAADDLPPPPRLPSISALLNETSSSTAPSPGPQSATPRSGRLSPLTNGYEGAAAPSYQHAGRPTVPDANSGPIASTSAHPLHPPSPQYPPVASASSETAFQAGHAYSQSLPLVRPASPPPRQLTSLEFPDGNALHPLPSGLSNGGGRRRATSASVVPPFEAVPYGRLPGFATSSERGGGSIGEPPLEAHDQHHDPRAGASSRLEAFRPRAFSTPTREEYRAHVGWAALPAVPARAPMHFPSRPPELHDGQHQGPDVAEAHYPPAPSYPYYPGPHGPPSHVHVAQHLPPEGWPAPPPLPYPPRHPPPLQLSGSSHSHEQPRTALPLPSGLPVSGPGSPPSSSSSSQFYAPPSGQSTWLPQAPAAVGQVQAGSTSPLLVASEASQDAGRYGCPHCPKRFARPSSLRIHMHSHTGEKPFTCPMCDRAFSVQSNLRRHLKIHKGGTATSGNAGGVGTASLRNLPRLATDPATMENAAQSPSEPTSKSSRTSSGSEILSASIGGTDGELDDQAIEEEDEDDAMAEAEAEEADAQEQKDVAAPKISGAPSGEEELRKRHQEGPITEGAPPLVRTA